MCNTLNVKCHRSIGGWLLPDVPKVALVALQRREKIPPPLEL